MVELGRGCHRKERGLYRRAWVIALVAIPMFAIIALLAWGLASSGGKSGGLIVNSRMGEVSVKVAPAPEFTLKTLDGENFALSGATGGLVMVEFWTSWCPPCITEAPVLEEVYRQYQDRGVEFVGIAIWDDERSVRDHVDKFDISYVNGLDKQGRIAIDYGVRGIPEKYFIDPVGQIVRKLIGPVEGDDLRGVLNGLLSEYNR